MKAIQAGDSIIIRSPKGQKGCIASAKQALVEALINIITPKGAIIMPAQSTGSPEPSY